MWPNHTNKYVELMLDVSNLTLDPKLNLFTDTNEFSPFERLPSSIRFVELPPTISDSTVATINLEIECIFLEKKEHITCWELRFNFNAGHYEWKWSCFVVTDGASYFNSKKQITDFLNDQHPLTSYIKGHKHEPATISQIARFLLSESSNSTSEDSIVLSNN